MITLLQKCIDAIRTRAKECDEDGLTHTSTVLHGLASELTLATFDDVYQHVKSGGKYHVLANGLMENDNTPCTIYQGTDGRIWVRPTTEFNEKFIKL